MKLDMVKIKRLSGICEICGMGSFKNRSDMTMRHYEDPEIWVVMLRPCL